MIRCIECKDSRRKFCDSIFSSIEAGAEIAVEIRTESGEIEAGVDYQIDQIGVRAWIESRLTVELGKIGCGLGPRQIMPAFESRS